MVRQIYIPLDANERQALARLGELEKRDPRQQAALLIREQLEKLGLLQPARTPKGQVNG